MMHLTTRFAVLWALCAALLPEWLAAEEVDVIKAALERPLIESKTPLEEARAFTTRRILPMPDPKTPAEWEAYAGRIRQETLDRVVFRGAAEEWRKAPTRVEMLESIEGGKGYTLRKLRYEVVPGLTIPAILYTPDGLKGKAPVALHVNGHDAQGKAADYKQIRCINLAKRGVIVLNVEWLNMGQLRSNDFTHYRMNQLDLCGTSGLAPFYLSMSRGIDILLQQPHADPTRVAVSGLSGGGWQTIFISALDTRVTLSNPVAGYSSFKTRAVEPSDLGDSEQTPVDLGATADYLQLTALRAPKPTLLTFNAKDNCCFKADHALPPLMDGTLPIYKLYGREAALRSHINEDPGDHNFKLDNRQQYYRMVGDFFFPGTGFDAKEIPCDAEVKTAEQLNVELPKDNAGFNTLAKRLMASLPRDAELPEPANREKWIKSRRAALAEILRAPASEARGVKLMEKSADGLKTVSWQFRVDDAWTVPATEIVRGEPAGTVLLIADAGRKSTAETVKSLLDRKLRVLAIDPFYLGESKFPSHDVLWGLMISTVGSRPLGVQTRQVEAIAAWSTKEFKAPPVVVSVGPRTGLIALCASALAPDSIGGVEAHGSLGSLKEIIEQNQEVTWGPESFCFGLLERFDIPQLAALSAPRKVRFVAPGDRVKSEASRLKAWYAAWDVSHDPLAP
ncbi:MAG: acetylxylan esterase [Planctomycetaceae bacterium]|nr:acetylxylan esterase [Planctomycetaceae bacterium]